jgi:hypothetical protein
MSLANVNFKAYITVDKFTNMQCATVPSSIYLNLIYENFIKLNVYSTMYMKSNIDKIILQKLLKLLISFLSNLRSCQTLWSSVLFRPVGSDWRTFGEFPRLRTKTMSIVELNFILSWNQWKIFSCSLLRLPLYFTTYTRNHVFYRVEKSVNVVSVTIFERRSLLSVLYSYTEVMYNIVLALKIHIVWYSDIPWP